VNRHRLLEGFLPASEAERQHLQAMKELATVPDCWSRDHFQPGHFTASAFILSPDERSLLLIHHSKLDRWLQPGGHIDPGDSDLIAAARREVAEEVGLSMVELLGPVPFDLDVHTIPARRTEPEHQHFDVRFLFRAPTFDFEAGSDALAARWVALEQVQEVESDASVMRAVGKLMGARG